MFSTPTDGASAVPCGYSIVNTPTPSSTFFLRSFPGKDLKRSQEWEDATPSASSSVRFRLVWLTPLLFLKCLWLPLYGVALQKKPRLPHPRNSKRRSLIDENSDPWVVKQLSPKLYSQMNELYERDTETWSQFMVNHSWLFSFHFASKGQNDGQAVGRGIQEGKD